MNAKAHRKLVRDCISFYEKRRWNWLYIVGYLCLKAVGELEGITKAQALAQAMRGITYKEKS